MAAPDCTTSGIAGEGGSVARISCLTVTLGTPDRLPMLAAAIADYAAQTHGPRELVIVTDRADAQKQAALGAMIAGFGRDDIRIVGVEPALTLGALRNLAVRSARGAFVCQWDDDDRHHPRRLEMQHAALEQAGADAVILADVLLLRPADASLRWTNWAATPSGGHPGTLLCRRSAMPSYPEEGSTASLGEDLDALLRIDARGTVHRLSGVPHLYVYVAHDANSWPPAHHAMLSDTLSISTGLLRRRERALREGVAPLALPPGLRVEGSNGLAFLL
jgi:hypothetical protein